MLSHEHYDNIIHSILNFQYERALQIAVSVIHHDLEIPFVAIYEHSPDRFRDYSEPFFANSPRYASATCPTELKTLDRNRLQSIYKTLSQSQGTFFHSNIGSVRNVFVAELAGNLESNSHNPKRLAGLLFLHDNLLETEFEDERAHALMQVVRLITLILQSEQRDIRAKKRANVLQKIYEIALHISQNRNLNDLLQNAVDASRELFNNPTRAISYIALTETRQKRRIKTPRRYFPVRYIRHVAASPAELIPDALDPLAGLFARPLDKNPRTGKEAKHKGQNIPIEARIGISGKVAKTGEGEVVPNSKIARISDHPQFIQLFQERGDNSKSTHSQVSVPMKFQGQTFGSISVEHMDDWAFSIDDKKNLELLTTLVGAAIENLRTTQWLQNLTKSIEGILAARNVDELCDEIINVMKEEFLASEGGIFLVQYSSVDQLEIGKLYPFGAASRSLGIPEIDPHDNNKQKIGMTGTLLNSNLDYLITDNYDREDYLHEDYGTNRPNPAVVKVKVKHPHTQKTIGILHIADAFGRIFTVEEAEKLIQFGKFAALVITHVQEIELQKRWNALVDSCLHSLSNIYTNNDEITHDLRELLSIAHHHFHASSATLYMYDAKSTRLVYEPIFIGDVGTGFRETFQLAHKINFKQHRIFANFAQLVNEFIDSDIMPYHLAPDVKVDEYASENNYLVSNGNIVSYFALAYPISTRVVGVMFLNYSSKQQFDDDLLFNRLLPFRQVSQTIVRYLYEQVRHIRLSTAIDQLSFISRRDPDINDYWRILDEVASTALSLMVKPNQRAVFDAFGNLEKRGCFSFIAELDSETGDLYHVAAAPKGVLPFLSSVERTNIHKVDSEPMGLTAKSAREKQLIYCPEVPSMDKLTLNDSCSEFRRVSVLEAETDSISNENIRLPVDEVIKSQISLPLVANNSVLGVLTLEHIDVDPFSDDEIRILKSFASYAALVMLDALEAKQRQESFGMFSHQVTDPLRNLDSELEKLIVELEPSHAFVGERIARIFNIKNDLQWISDNFLYYLIDAKSRSDSTEAVNVIELVDDVFRSFSYDVLYRGISLETEFNDYVEKGSFVVLGRRLALKSAFLNIVNNAVFFTNQYRDKNNIPLETVLRVTARIEVINGLVLIAFLDEGTGFKRNDTHYYFRKQDSDTRHGIGLSVTRKIIREHNGDIELHNRSDSRGAQIKITLPVMNISQMLNLGE